MPQAKLFPAQLDPGGVGIPDGAALVKVAGNMQLAELSVQLLDGVQMLSTVINIAGTNAVGDTLTAATEGGTPVVVQWTRDGLDIPGALGTSYTILDTDDGHQIWWRAPAAGTGIPVGEGIPLVTLGSLTLTTTNFGAAMPGDVLATINGVHAGAHPVINPSDLSGLFDVSVSAPWHLLAGANYPNPSPGTDTGVTVHLQHVLAGATNTPLDVNITGTILAAVGGGGGAVAVPYIIPGLVNSTDTHIASSWAESGPAPQQGAPGDEGYAYEVSGANWACGRLQESLDTQEIYIGAVGAGTPTLASYAANDQFCNMKQFEYSIGDGAWAVSNAPTAHPVHGKVAYWGKVRASDLPAGAPSGLYEVRCRPVPQVGICFPLEGIDSPDPGIINSLAAQASFSCWVILDKGDLPRLTIYKAPNDGTTDAADAHAGTVGDPCRTWKRVRDLQRAHANYPQVLTTILLTDGLNHDWGLQSGVDDAPVESLGWTTIKPAPGATVAITNWRGAALAAPGSDPATDLSVTKGRIPWRKFFLKGVDIGDLPIDNVVFVAGSADGYYGDHGFSSRCEDITTTSRDTTLGAGGTMDQQPLNPDWFNHGGSAKAVEFANCTIEYAATANLYQSTYIRDVTLNHIANWGDMADNCRYIAGLHFTNIAEHNQTDNHLDALQATLGNAFSIRQPRAWIEGVKAYTSEGWDAVSAQLILNDTADGYADTVVYNLDTDSKFPYNWGIAQKNNRVVNPNVAASAGGQIPSWTWDGDFEGAGRPYQSAPNENTWYLLDNTHAGLAIHENYFQRGVHVIHPFTTAIPNPGNTIPVSPYQARIDPTKDINQLWDMDIPEYVLRTQHDDSFPAVYYGGGVIKCKGVVDAVRPELPTRLNGGFDASGYLQNQLTEIGLDTQRPTVIEGTHRKLKFDKTQQQGLVAHVYPLLSILGHIDDGSMTNTPGTVLTVDQIIVKGRPLAAGYQISMYPYVGTITGQLSGTPGGVGTYSLDTIGLGGWAGSFLNYATADMIMPDSAPKSVMMALNVLPTAAGGEQYFMHSGRSGVLTTYVGTTFSGGSQVLFSNCGKTNGSDTYNYFETTGGPSPLGPTVVNLECLADRNRIEYWNAATHATPGTGSHATVDGFGYREELPFGAGYTLKHTLQGNNSISLGCGSTGLNGFCDVEMYAFILSSLLDATSKANILADFKALLGLA